MAVTESEPSPSRAGSLALVADDLALDFANTESGQVTVMDVAAQFTPGPFAVAVRFSPEDAQAGRMPAVAVIADRGICETRMCTEMPARKPTVTGMDKRLAIPPRRKTPLAISNTPTINASAMASAW